MVHISISCHVLAEMDPKILGLNAFPDLVLLFSDGFQELMDWLGTLETNLCPSNLKYCLCQGCISIWSSMIIVFVSASVRFYHLLV